MRYRFTRLVKSEHAVGNCLSPCLVCGRVMLRQAQHERLWAGHASTSSARTVVVGSCFDRLSTNDCGRVMLRQAQHERLWSGHASTGSARTVVVGSCFDKLSTNGCGRVTHRQAQHERLWSGHASTLRQAKDGQAQHKRLRSEHLSEGRTETRLRQFKTTKGGDSHEFR